MRNARHTRATALGFITAGLVAVQAASSCAQAAEVRLLSSAGIKPVVDAIKPEFERATGHTLSIKYVLSPQVPVAAQGGEAFDVAITLPSLVEGMIKQSLVAAGSAANIAKFDLGVGVRAGATKPDVATPEAVKRTLLGASSIAYVSAGATGPMVTGMLDRLGIAAEVTPKLKAGGVASSQAAVASGEAEMMVLPVPLIKEAKGVELVGALPAPFTNSTVMTAGISSNAGDRAAAQALVMFLTSSAADNAIATSGYQRVSAVPAATAAAGTGLGQERISPDDLKNLKWRTSPNGTSQATVIGDPTKPGLYVIISKFPAGQKTPVHFHPDDRIVTVVSGTAYFGYGETFDEANVKAMPPGSIVTEPSKMPHYNWAKDGELVLQIVGNGPTATTPFRAVQ
jgi:molybdate transport system substrate-binding protein